MQYTSYQTEDISESTTTLPHRKKSNNTRICRTPRIYGIKKQALTLPASTESRNTRLARIICYGNKDAQKMLTTTMSFQNLALNA